MVNPGAIATKVLYPVRLPMADGSSSTKLIWFRRRTEDAATQRAVYARIRDQLPHSEHARLCQSYGRNLLIRGGDPSYNRQCSMNVSAARNGGQMGGQRWPRWMNPLTKQQVVIADKWSLRVGGNGGMPDFTRPRGTGSTTSGVPGKAAWAEGFVHVSPAREDVGTSIHPSTRLVNSVEGSACGRFLAADSEMNLLCRRRRPDVLPGAP